MSVTFDDVLPGRDHGGETARPARRGRRRSLVALAGVLLLAPGARPRRGAQPADPSATMAGPARGRPAARRPARPRGGGAARRVHRGPVRHRLGSGGTTSQVLEVATARPGTTGAHRRGARSPARSTAGRRGRALDARAGGVDLLMRTTRWSWARSGPGRRPHADVVVARRPGAPPPPPSPASGSTARPAWRCAARSTTGGPGRAGQRVRRPDVGPPAGRRGRARTPVGPGHTPSTSTRSTGCAGTAGPAPGRCPARCPWSTPGAAGRTGPSCTSATPTASPRCRCSSSAAAWTASASTATGARRWAGTVSGCATRSLARWSGRRGARVHPVG